MRVDVKDVLIVTFGGSKVEGFVETDDKELIDFHRHDGISPAMAPSLKVGRDEVLQLTIEDLQALIGMQLLSLVKDEFGLPPAVKITFNEDEEGDGEA